MVELQTVLPIAVSVVALWKDAFSVSAALLALAIAHTVHVVMVPSGAARHKLAPCVVSSDSCVHVCQLQ